MDKIDELMQSPDEAKDIGESWEEAAVRLRGQNRRLHPLVREVFE